MTSLYNLDGKLKLIISLTKKNKVKIQPFGNIFFWYIMIENFGILQETKPTNRIHTRYGSDYSVWMTESESRQHNVL